MRQSYIENRTFDELQVGDSACLARSLTLRNITLLAVMSGGVNPAQVDGPYAKTSRFHEIIAHGLRGSVLISTLRSTQLPEPGRGPVECAAAGHRPAVDRHGASLVARTPGNIPGHQQARAALSGTTNT